MANGLIEDSYILENFNKALNDHYIKVYYQPVVRTISRKYCGFEALARWEDPDKGLLSPASFIGVLENNNLIHLLDSYIINKICHDLRYIINNSHPILPVSFNISRLDFESCDMFSTLDDAVNKYAIPKDLINIEITETAINADNQLVIAIIDKFKSAGYQVWMDDFGNGYSSLNALKDFNFDTLKIDMKFLSDLRPKSRAIIRAVVEMSKNIGMKTLAEGVETEEQYEFLKYIGCEKVQGYLFSRPRPFNEILKELLDDLSLSEGLWERKYYDSIGNVNVLSSAPFTFYKDDNSYGLKELDSIPLTIIEISEQGFDIIYENDAFKAEIKTIGLVYQKEEIIEFIKKNLIVGNRVATLFAKTRVTGHEEITFAENGQYFILRTQLIANGETKYAVLFSFQNLTRSDASRHDRLDSLLRNIYSIYDSVYIFDLAKNIVEIPYLANNGASLQHTSVKTIDTIEEFTDTFIKNQIYPNDYHDLIEFLDFKDIRSRIHNSGRNFLNKYVRVIDIKGEYQWKICIATIAGKDEILILLRNADSNVVSLLNQNKDKSELENSSEISNSILWQSLIENSSIGIFWKDKDRKFLGANRTFLDYYGMDNIDRILNKNDEEVGWHVEPGPYKEDEERVIKEGFVTHEVPGHCIIRGIERSIIASKMPVYKNGSIVGLVGYFKDVTDLNEEKKKREANIIDNLTGLLNVRGMMLELLRFSDAFEFHKQDFAIISLKVSNFDEVKKYLGKNISKIIVQKMANVLIKSFGNSATIGRFTGDEFIIVFQFTDEIEVEKTKNNILERISGIHSANGNSCTLYPVAGKAIYSKFMNIEETIKASQQDRYQAMLESMTNARSKK